MSGRWYRESCWNGGKKKKDNETCMGWAFLMPHTECAHRQAQTQISNENPPSLCSAMHLIRPTGHFLWSKAKHYMRSKGFTFEMQPIQTPVSNLRRGFLLHITISIHSLEFSLGMSTAAHFVFSVLLCPSVRPSVTAGLCLPGTCTRRWTPPSFSGPISRSQSKCKCPKGTAEW